MTERLELPAEPAILVITLRRIGDVLLTTPLIRSLKQGWPGARIDVLVFADTAGILAGNPDIDHVITMPQRPSAGESLALARKLWRRYALAVSTQPGDRPTYFAVAAGRTRASLVGDRFNGRVKSLLLHRSAPADSAIHRVEEMLQLATALGVAPLRAIVGPRESESSPLRTGRYAVIQAAPMYRYKRWTIEGWRELVRTLQARGLDIVVTGGPDPAERRYLDEVWENTSSGLQRVDGQLAWPAMAALLSKASLYVGPDTSTTHLAAASGVPTVALFGPTDPRIWGPWPAGGLDRPWAAAGRIQRRGNVWLVQNPLPCLPCQLEGCERHRESYSACLDGLSVAQVMTAVDQSLAHDPESVLRN